MMNRANKSIPRLLTASLLLSGVTLVACKKEEPPPPPPPPPPRAPQKVDAQSFVTDPRVQFPEAHAPLDESIARAAADLASALARGDASAFEAMLDAPSRAVLAQQRQTGAWERETRAIEVVRIVGLTVEDSGATLTLAVQDPRGAYLLAWKGVRSGETWVFGGAEAEDRRAARASDLDSAGL
ncbi:MAG: hypothetical protein KF684_12605 [Phycisphaeraceae bacterium]|nr:hypothetical protein [Phycisphaeraceae bacterium]